MKALRILILVLLSATAFAQGTTVYSGGLTTPNTWTQTQTFLGPVAVLNGAYNAASCGGANPPSWCAAPG